MTDNEMLIKYHGEELERLKDEAMKLEFKARFEIYFMTDEEIEDLKKRMAEMAMKSIHHLTEILRLSGLAE